MGKYEHLLDDTDNLSSENFQFKDYTSASQIKGFNCPTRWADNILNSSANTGSPPTAFGDFMHLVFERLSLLALEDYDGYTGKIPFEVAETYFSEIITLYPILINEDWVARGMRQLTFWYNEEKSREAKVFVTDEGKPGVEVNFYCYLKSGMVVRGIIDRIETNKYTKENELDFVDWKTGFLKDDHTSAMTLYKMAGQQIVAKNKIIKTKIVELEREYFQYYDITEENIVSYNKLIILTKQAMENFSTAILKYISEKNWDGLYTFMFDHAVFNKWCYTCRLSSVCKVYINKIYGYVPGLSDTEDMSREKVIDYLVEQEEHLKMIAKSIKKMLENIDSRLINIISLNGGDPVHIDEDRKLELTYSSRRNVMESISIPIILKRNFIEMLKIGIKDHDEVIKDLESQLDNSDEHTIDELEKDINLLNASVYTVKGKENWKITRKKKTKKTKE